MTDEIAKTADHGAANRPGELLEHSIKVAENYIKPSIETVMDEATGIKMNVVLFSGTDGESPRIEIINPAAFDNHRENPVRRLGTATMTRLTSFVDHVNRFKDSQSIIFAREGSSPRLVAVLDYHESREDLDKLAKPRFGDHRTQFNFPLSDEWKAWAAMNGEKMGLLDLAQFLEDRITDIVLVGADELNEDMKQFVAATDAKIATPSSMMALSRGLSIYENSNVTDVRNLSSGETQVSFTSDHVDADGKPVNIPNLFVICIPVFANEQNYYRIAARLRYRKSGSSISFWYELWRADKVMTQAFDEAGDYVAEATGLPLLIGSDEE